MWFLLVMFVPLHLFCRFAKQFGIWWRALHCDHLKRETALLRPKAQSNTPGDPLV